MLLKSLATIGCFFLLIGCREKKQFRLMEQSDTGLHFRNDIQETPANNIMTYQYMYNGAGIAAGDLNHDGLADLYFSGNSVPNKLFLNKGDWTFEDITEAAAITDRSGDWKTGVSMVDINADGWLDIYLCYSGNDAGEGLRKPVIIDNPRRSNQLFINNGCEPGGKPTFTESAKAYGLDAPGSFSTQSYFFDYDGDGDLDMFLLNHANTFYSSLFNPTRLRNLRHPSFGNKLFRNDSLHFVDVSVAAGIHGSGLNFGLSAGISDLNADGWPDLYVTNDYDEQDFMYLNQGNGRFREVSHTALSHLSKNAMGCDIADINNDGLPDLLTVDMLPEDNHRQKLLKGGDQYDKYTLSVDSGFHHQYMRNTLQVNCGNGNDTIPRFMELGQMAGLSNTDWSWAPLFVDLDNDGRKDAVISNGYLHDFTNLDFLKFAQGETMGNAAEKQSTDLLALVQQMPSTRLNNYVFRNTGGLHFENVSDDWGFSHAGISNGMLYADLDNDGDLDLVINSLNDPIAVYQNQSDTAMNGFIKIRLEGKKPNTFGIGAKIWIEADSQKIFQEAYFSRGYESSVEPVFTIGIGKAKTIAVTVRWPDGSISQQKQIVPNRQVIFSQSSAEPSTKPLPGIISPMFTDMLGSSGIKFVHQENHFVDYKVQRLLPYQPSRLGTRLAVADINNDGNDDIYFGGAIGQSGSLYLAKDDGSFYEGVSQPWTADRMSEDVAATFFDADNDADLDLYVVSGGNEYGSGDPLYHDRLYINEGNAVFRKAPDALPPAETTSGSCVVSADFDKDGDLDLFVGGRVAAQLYPLNPKSYLLRNDSKGADIRFTDITEKLNAQWQTKGMLTDAIWTDINNDSWPDLIVIGEWMPITVFENQAGKAFVERTTELGLSGTEGWWSRIVAADIDADGDLDFLLGNAGTNLQYKASPQQPLDYYIQDINGDGGPDPVLCYYVQGKSYPAASLDELTEQLPGMRKKFYKYADYADATINDLMDKNQLDAAFRLRINTLQSSWIENKGNGKFIVKPLPEAAQVSMLNGFAWEDFDGDGRKELLCAGNFYPYKVEWGRSDAFMGTLLRFEKGNLQVYKANTPLWLNGDIRDICLLKSRHGGKRLLVFRNNDRPGLYRYGN